MHCGQILEKKGKSVEKGEKSINQEGRQQLTYL